MTAKKSLRLLLVEDSPDDMTLMLRQLQKDGYAVTHERVETADAMQNALSKPWDAIICDYVMPRFDALSALSLLKKSGHDLPFIIVSGTIGEQTAVEAMKAGAHDYLMKGNLTRLAPAIEREIREAKSRAQRAWAEQELVRSNKELEQFVFFSSHDLQEPLRKLLMYVQLLSTEYKGRLEGEADKYINVLVDSATRMKNLIEELLAYSLFRREGTAAERVSLEEIFRQMLRDLEISIRESGAVITHDPLPDVVANAGQMRQLLQNLISNALKYHGEKKPAIHVGAENRKTDWVFSVRDNGIGIDPKYNDRIFKFFQRLHTQEEYPGTGLGLAICAKIVERHGGRIWVESTVGNGSTFYFTIPIRNQ